MTRRRAAWILALAALAGSACEIYGGRLQWAGSPSANPVRRDCQSAGAGYRSWIRVRTDIPGMEVTVRDAESPHAVSGKTDREGLFDAHVGAGRWTIEVSAPGWRSSECDLGLAPEQVCTVSFDMEYVPSIESDVVP